MHADFLLERFEAAGQAPAIVWRDQEYSYEWLLGSVENAGSLIRQAGVPAGSVVAIEADFSPQAVALLLALVQRDAVLVPLTTSVEEKKPEFRAIAQTEVRIRIDDEDRLSIERLPVVASHPLLLELKRRQHPGLVLFSSGSTGASKAAVHDLVPMLEKFKVRRHTKRALSFLLFDHIGGFNTLFYNLSNAGCVVTVPDRRPETVCRAIARHRVQLLPTSPTFINLMLLSEAWKINDLSSLETITYGTEVMPESTLARLREALPHVSLLQTYGLSEVGILRSKSRSSDSLWVKVGGEGFQTRVVDGMLEIKAQSAMLGYLNAPSPFTEDGWFMTGDAVEVDGEWLKILGRRSELINVGGEKVYPAEVEGVLQSMQGVEDVAVCGVPNPITGQAVLARVKLTRPEELSRFRERMHAHCRGKLERFKIPQKVELVEGDLHGERFKKMRRL